RPHLARPDGPRMVPEPDDALPSPAAGGDDAADDDALAVAGVHGLRHPADGQERAGVEHGGDHADLLRRMSARTWAMSRQSSRRLRQFVHSRTTNTGLPARFERSRWS